jgi:hypothetical protein
MSDMHQADQPSVSKKTLAAIGVAGALGFGFLVGSLASATPSFAQTPSSSSDSGTDSNSTPADPGSSSGTPAPHQHGGGHCPNMGGSSGSDSGSTASNSGASFGV